MEKRYISYLFEQLRNLSEIPSPTGYYTEMQEYLFREVEAMGYAAQKFNRGGFRVDLGGQGDTLVITSHMDDIGLSVRYIDGQGRLHLNNIGGLYAPYTLFSNVTVITRSGKKYTGTVQKIRPSVHQKLSAEEIFERMEYDTNIVVYLDKFVSCRQDVEDLGIHCGDFIALQTNYTVTEDGFIKSRFLDDKSCTAVLLTYMKYLKEEKVELSRHIVAHFSAFEETGNGGCTGLPDDICEMIALDIGVVGGESDAREDKVSICVRDARGHYSRDVVNLLIELAEKNTIPHSVDVNMPSYGSDTNAAIEAGYDIRHSCFGPGVFATHGYERAHKEGIAATLQLLTLYAK